MKLTAGVGTSRAMRTGCANARLQLNANVLLLEAAFAAVRIKGMERKEMGAVSVSCMRKYHRLEGVVACPGGDEDGVQRL